MLIFMFMVILGVSFFIFETYLKNTKTVTYVANIQEKILTHVQASSTMNKKEEHLFEYVEVIDGCNEHFVGDCINMRSGPGTQYPIVVHLRTGVVLKVAESVIKSDGMWYKILFSNELLYPERVKSDWYVKAEFVQLFSDEGNKELKKGKIASSTKHIVIDISEQKIYAYDNDKLFMEEYISTGLEFTPTPKGTFTIFKMTPSRFMQGPIPGVSDQVYDLPGVPWNLYFTREGAVIHGAYWHNHFGKPWSHGCVNLSPQNAKRLYQWAEIGTRVIVQK